MKSRLLAAMCTACLVLSAQTVLEVDFSPASVKDWKMPDYASIKQDAQGVRYLEIDMRRAPAGAYGRAVMPFDFSQYAGKTIRMSAEMSYEGVTKPAQSYNGTKFMMVYDTRSTGRKWKHGAGYFGSSPWKMVTYGTEVEPDAQPGAIEFGLQESTGIVRFRKFSISVVDMSKIFPRLTPEDYRCVYTARVKNEPVRRGVMSTGNYTDRVIEDDLPTLKRWGGDLYRWQLIRNWNARNDNQDREEYLNWVRGKLPGTKKVLDKAHELGIRVVLDLHVAPGGRGDAGHMNMFEKPEFAETFLESWRILATAVKGHPALYGYDLINEPSQPTEAVACDYLTLQYRAAQVVRAIDPDTPIIIEAKDWDAAPAFKVLSPLPMKDVIYQAHMYHPFQFTHQGVGANKKGGDLYYPNPDPARNFTKDSIRAYVQPVRDFQLKHGARIYIGEFSAIRWAKGAEEFLKDAIEIFEEYGWDWSYHAFREWDGWSVEHTEDPSNPAPATYETARKKALLKGFGNKRP